MELMPRRQLRRISEAELATIISNVMHQKVSWKYADFARIRTSTCLYFMYYTGLRPKECYAARLDYLNLRKKTYYIPASSNKQRFEDEIPLPAFLIDKLIAYRYIRKKYFPDSEWLFPSSEGHVSRGTFIRQFNKAVDSSGLSHVSYIDKRGCKRRNITLYNLRISYGTNVYLKTHDVIKTRIALRQRDILCRSVFYYVFPSIESMDRASIIQEVYG